MLRVSNFTDKKTKKYEKKVFHCMKLINNEALIPKLLALNGIENLFGNHIV